MLCDQIRYHINIINKCTKLFEHLLHHLDMFVYSLFKGVRKGYIDKSYLEVAVKGYKGILDNFIEVDKNGVVSITKACAVAGLGGKVYRSGDYDYYINETIRNNDPKAVGPFILASLEWERLQDVKVIVNRK